MPARAVATRGSAMAAGGLGYARSVCRGSPVLCHSLDENLRLIRKSKLCGRPIGRVATRDRLLTADMGYRQAVVNTGLLSGSILKIGEPSSRYRAICTSVNDFSIASPPTGGGLGAPADGARGSDGAISARSCKPEAQTMAKTRKPAQPRHRSRSGVRPRASAPRRLPRWC
jgi:hypothetical protein